MYVYALMDPRTKKYTYKDTVFSHKPFYIGITRHYRKRMMEHSWSWVNKDHKPKTILIRELKSEGLTFKGKIIARNLNINDALELEKVWINQLGRADKSTGILLNTTAGGEGTSQRIYTPEQRQHLSDLFLGRSLKKHIEGLIPWRDYFRYVSGFKGWNVEANYWCLIHREIKLKPSNIISQVERNNPPCSLCSRQIMSPINISLSRTGMSKIKCSKPSDIMYYFFNKEKIKYLSRIRARDSIMRII